MVKIKDFDKIRDTHSALVSDAGKHLRSFGKPGIMPVEADQQIRTQVAELSPKMLVGLHEYGKLDSDNSPAHRYITGLVEGEIHAKANNHHHSPTAIIIHVAQAGLLAAEMVAMASNLPEEAMGLARPNAQVSAPAK